MDYMFSINHYLKLDPHHLITVLPDSAIACICFTFSYNKFDPLSTKNRVQVILYIYHSP